MIGNWQACHSLVGFFLGRACTNGASLLDFVRNLCRMREQKLEFILLLLFKYFDIVCLVCKYKRNGKLTFHYKSFIISCLSFTFCPLQCHPICCFYSFSSSQFFSGVWHVGIQLPFIYFKISHEISLKGQLEKIWMYNEFSVMNGVYYEITI